MPIPKINLHIFIQYMEIDKYKSRKVLYYNKYINRQTADNALSRRLPTNDCTLRCQQINIQLFNDFFFDRTKEKSIRGNSLY